MTGKITPNQWTILERLAKGRCWCRSLQTVRPLVENLIERCLVERCKPPTGRANNMYRLTDLGCELLEIAPADVPGEARASVQRQRIRGPYRRFEGGSPAIVCRDPCPRCGVRADVGCQHSAGRLGMVF